MDIALDSNQAGIIGDMVPSNLGGAGKKHFVTPKHSNYAKTLYTNYRSVMDKLPFGLGAGPSVKQLYAEKVTLVADPVASFTADHEWVNATPTGGAPHKATVSRTAAGHHKVQIKNKKSGTIEAELHVWVVWSTITATAVPSLNGDQGASFRYKMGYRFVHTVAPSAIISAGDRPDLSGANAVSVPPVGGTNYSGNAVSGGATRKWDSSRIFRQKVINTAGVPLGAPAYFHANYDFYPSLADGDGQPGGTGLIGFRDWLVVGNDDTGVGDEDNNPYDASGTARALDGYDAPANFLPHGAGANGNSVEWRMHFKEFTRVEIAGKWYLISDHFPWRVHHRARKVGGKWTDNASSQALDNAGF